MTDTPAPTPEHVEELLKLAEAATPGPWTNEGGYVGTDHPCPLPKGFENHPPCGAVLFEQDGATMADCDFVAAFDPPTASSICRSWLAMREEVERLKQTLEFSDTGWAAACAGRRKVETENAALSAEVERLRDAGLESNHAVEQTLGKVLGYPWYKDDQKNFPGSTEADGVCVAEHVAETIAAEAANKITAMSARLEAATGLLRECREEVMQRPNDWITKPGLVARVSAFLAAPAPTEPTK